MKYRKKPIVIEAVQTGPGEALEEAILFIEGDPTQVLATITSADSSGATSIRTLEGVMKASPGDWIIRGVQGEYYPCKPDIFEATYEQVTDQ